MALFKRFRSGAAAGDAAVAERLGSDWIAVRREAGSLAPAQCVTLLYGESGNSRRLVSFRSDGGAAKIACMKGERAWCFHPGPYVADIVPFAGAPEVGLRMVFVIDAADPRVTQQRFDLFLVSEMDAELAQLTLEAFAAQSQAAVRAALEQGVLDLPPCTSLDEWNLFRAGLNELMYIRFGVTVEDCVPVDLAPAVDFAAMLRGRAAAQATAAPPAYHGVSLQPPATLAATPEPESDAASPAWPTAAAAPSAPAPTPRAAPGSLPAPGLAPTVPAGVIMPGTSKPATSQAPDASDGVSAPPTSPAPASPAGPAPAAAPPDSADPAGSPSNPALMRAGPAGAPQVAPAAPAAVAGSHLNDSQLPPGWASGHSSRAAKRDALAIRRLFLELPAISAALRQVALPEGQKIFKQQQAILQRLSLLALDAGTMPSLDWAAPDQRAEQSHRAGRAEQGRRAVTALDEAWSLLARLKQAGPDETGNCLQEADRIVANLEYHLARRRNIAPQPQERVEPRL